MHADEHQEFRRPTSGFSRAREALDGPTRRQRRRMTLVFAAITVILTAMDLWGQSIEHPPIEELYEVSILFDTIFLRLGAVCASVPILVAAVDLSRWRWISWVWVFVAPWTL